MSCRPFHLKQRMTHTLPHHESERQWSINNIRSWILGLSRLYADQLTTELLTTVIAKNTLYKKKNTDSKLINIASCMACKHVLLAVENAILMRYYLQTAKTRVLCESIDGPDGWPAENLPNSVGLGVCHQTVPGLTWQGYLKARLPFWQRLRSNPDPDPKWRSGTVANTGKTLCNLVVVRQVARANNGILVPADRALDMTNIENNWKWRNVCSKETCTEWPRFATFWRCGRATKPYVLPRRNLAFKTSRRQPQDIFRTWKRSSKHPGPSLNMMVWLHLNCQKDLLCHKLCV